MALVNEVIFIFPHQLFKQHPAIKKGVTVYIIEETLFYNQYNFHKQKIVLHRASMKYYADYLRQQDVKVIYVEAKNKQADVRNLIAAVAKEKITTIHFCDVTDNWLNKRIHAAAKQHNIALGKLPSPNFLNTPESVAPFFNGKKHYFQTAFYIQQRKERNILLLTGKEPEGGQWTFDSDNRLKYPKNATPPVVMPAAENKYILEAIIYTEKNFKNNYGFSAPFIYPITFDDAENWLYNFLKNRFEKFGIYEDAIVDKEHFLHHSVLTPMLNIGLLQPQQIINAAIAAAPKYNVPLNSLEGFIRQIIGWREFIQIVYAREGTKQRTKNYWGFNRKIPASFWTGETGIAPIDSTIKKILQTGYCHHIERLMVLGNFMLLCEFDPDEVYKWYMEMFVDAYDWVMVPNVYGMTQFADGGMMTTKPYISGSNYLFKMSDYKKGEWSSVWDGLFWRFMHVHRSFFLQNPRLGMLVNTLDKMSTEKQQLHFTHADKFLNNLDSQIKE